MLSTARRNSTRSANARRQRKLRSVTLAAIAASPSCGVAAPVTWKGVAGNSWSLQTNWDTGSAPASNDSVGITNVGSGGSIGVDFDRATPLSLNDMNIANGMLLTQTVAASLTIQLVEYLRSGATLDV